MMPREKKDRGKMIERREIRRGQATGERSIRVQKFDDIHQHHWNRLPNPQILRNIPRIKATTTVYSKTFKGENFHVLSGK